MKITINCLNYKVGKFIEKKPKIEKLHSILDFEEQLDFYNKEIQSLAFLPDNNNAQSFIDDIEGIFFSYKSGRPSEYTFELSRIYSRKRLRECNRLKEKINKCKTYEQKLEILINWNVAAINLRVFKISNFISESTIDLIPKTQQEIIVFNQLLYKYFRNILNEGFQNEYYQNLIAADVINGIKEQKRNAINPDIVLEEWKIAIESRFAYPEMRNYESILSDREKYFSIYKIENGNVEFHQALFNFLMKGNKFDFSYTKLTPEQIEQLIYIEEIIAVYKFLNTPHSTTPTKSIAPIQWKRSQRLLGHLFDELVKSGFIDNNAPINKIIQEHFVDKNNKSIGDSIKQNRSGASNSNKNSKPKGHDKLDSIIESLKNKE